MNKKLNLLNEYRQKLDSIRRYPLVKYDTGHDDLDHLLQDMFNAAYDLGAKEAIDYRDSWDVHPAG